MVTLPVTLCAIDCAQPLLSLRALDLSMQQLSFADVVFLTDRPEQYRLNGCRIVGIPPITSRAEYSRFVVRELGQYFDTPHVLLIQWDGYIVNADAWRDEYLNFDYIGAPWGMHHDAYRVGNGGFSLRSRKLQDSLADPTLVKIDPEDEAICRRYRPFLESRHGIRFAPESLAAQFSFETTYPDGTTFGFHGLFNMWMFLRPDGLPAFVNALSARTVAGPQLLRLGQNYLELGRKDEAAIVLKRRLAVTPDDETARRLLDATTKPLGSASRRNDPCPCGSGRRFKHCCGSGANAFPSRANRPIDPVALLNEALRFHQAGRLNDAEALYGQVLRLDAQNPHARHYLGVLAMQRGDAVQGESMIRDALALEANPDAHNNLGLCLRLQNRLEDAVTSYRDAIAMKPDYAEAWNNSGLDLLALGQVEESVVACRQAIALNPQFSEAHWNLGLALLTLGQYPEGWAQYEWRTRCQSFSADGLNLADIPPWQGESLHGKTLLVRREQGMGDTLQFMRFIPELRNRGARILLDVPEDLVDLARSVVSEDELLDRKELPPQFDYYVNLLSLPSKLSVTIESLPGRMPYIFADTLRISQWKKYFGERSSPRIGLVWAGNPKHKNDHNRSCPLSKLEPLLKLTHVAWFSLQKGRGREQLDTIDSNPITDLADHLITYADTAAAIMALDLVITVDTSVAHLAGALGRPVWVMLPYAPDWRWLLIREDSPWYPTTRLFRQKQSGDWESLGRDISKELQKYHG